MENRVRLKLFLLRQLKLGLEYGWQELGIEILCFRIIIDLHKTDMEFFRFANYFKQKNY